MKLKLLILFITFGIFALGTRVMAAEPKAPTLAEKNAGQHAHPNPVVKSACEWILEKANLPSKCKKACEKAELNEITWTIDFETIGCCLKNAHNKNQLSSGLVSALKGFCKNGCNQAACAVSGMVGTLTHLCGSFCCDSKFGSVENCMNAADDDCVYYKSCPAE